MTRPRSWARALAALPAAVLLASFALVATSLIGWSVEVDASALHRVGDDMWLFLTSAMAGASAGALVAWVLTNRAAVLLAGALIGVTPALLKASAYFTSTY
jgi:membrane protein YqaA with SNARE-associated domain